MRQVLSEDCRGPDDGDLRRRASALVPEIRERASLAESLRRVPDENIEALLAAGLFRALVPGRFGGSGESLLSVHDTLVDVATGCASTGWVAALFSFHAYMVCWFDERAQREVWSDGPDARVASSVAPVGRAREVPGGFRLDGRWPLSSGINHADWVVLLANEAAPGDDVRSRACLVPVGDCEVQNDWRSAGLQGTGSNSIMLADVFVPEYRSETMAAVNSGDARGMQDGTPTGPRTWRPIFNYCFCPVALGCALEMIRLFREYTATRRAANTGQWYRDKASTLMRLGESVGEVDVARLLHRRDIGEIQRWDGLDAREADAVVARASYGSALVAELCRSAVARLFRGSGGHAVYATSPLQRLFRDAHTITQHLGLDFDAARENYGRTLIDDVGLEVIS